MFQKKRSRFGYVVKQTRAASPAAAGFPVMRGGKKVSRALKKLAYIGVLLVLFSVAAGQIARYIAATAKTAWHHRTRTVAAARHEAPAPEKEKPAVVKKRETAKNSFNPGFFASQKYLISAGNYYRVYTSGKIEMVAESLGNADYPFLTGIKTEEDRPAHLKALKQALSIGDECLEGISEVCLRDPDNMYMLKTEGEKIIFGDSITREKLDNYIAAREKLEELGKRFTTMDLRYKNRAVIK